MANTSDISSLGNLLVPVIMITMGFSIFFYVQEMKFHNKEIENKKVSKLNNPDIKKED